MYNQWRPSILSVFVGILAQWQQTAITNAAIEARAQFCHPQG
jgi:hypothetical protein